MTDQRREIAKLINGVAFRPANMAPDDTTQRERWLRARSVAFYKADMILAYLSQPATPAEQEEK